MLDQYTKHLAKRKLKNKKKYVYKKSILNFTYIENTGAAFGIFKGKRIFITVAGLLSLIFIVSMFLDTHEIVLYKASLAMIISGAIGNLYDRIKYGYVIDFIHIKVKKIPIFNIADVFIFIGALLLSYSVLVYDINY